jgi:hypothetical protein
VDLSLKQRTMSILLTEIDIGFHNVVISTLFYCMRVVWNFAHVTVLNKELISNGGMTPVNELINN